MVQHFALTLRLHFRNRLALLYGYLFPAIFLAAFWALYRHEQVPLLLHMGELLTVSVLGGACFGLPTTMVSERERGVWEHYQLTPVGRWPIVISTLAARFVLVASAGAVQLALALAIGMTAPNHPWTLALGFGIVTFAFIGLGLVIAAVADNVPAVQALGQCLFLPLLLLGGIAIPIGSLPTWAQHVSAFLPGRYAVTALQNAVNGGGLRSAAFDLLVLALIGTAALFIGTRLFRWRPGKRTRRRSEIYWLLGVMASWVLVGVMAETRDHVIITAAAPASSSKVAAIVSAPPQQPWQKLTEADLNRIDFSVPSDSGLVTPIATAEEAPDDETDLTLAKLEGELPHWAPGHAPDPVQRVRNLLSVAAVVDLLQNPVERFVPALVEQRLQAEFPRDQQVQLLAWIALHPGEGQIIVDLSDLHLGGPVAETAARERAQIYAIKLLARATGRKTTAK